MTTTVPGAGASMPELRYRILDRVEQIEADLGDAEGGPSAVLRRILRAYRVILDQHLYICGDTDICVTCGVRGPCPTLRIHADALGVGDGLTQ